jgi:hypothetical protein
MLNFAREVSELAHNIGKMDTIAVKVASVQSSHEAQITTAVASSKLYDVIIKRATDDSKASPAYIPVVECVQKIASYLGKPNADPQLLLKLAAAVAVDDAINETLPALQGDEQDKLAQVQFYGREYFVELLRGVI